MNGLAGCYVSAIGKAHEYFDLTGSGDRRGSFNDSVNVRFSEAGRITPSDEADFLDAASIAGATAGFRPGADTERERR